MVAFAFLMTAVYAADMSVSDRPALIDARTEARIERTLAWLAEKQQNIDGSWSQETPGGDFHSARYPVVTTSLMGLAILSHGDTPGRGRYSKNILRSIEWILSRADPKTGFISDPNEGERPIYGHTYATLFLAEIHGMEPTEELSQRIEAVLVSAVRVIETSQGTHGGWDYGLSAPKGWMGRFGQHDDSEGSTTVCAIQALRAAKNAGIPVKITSIEKGLDYLTACEHKDSGGVVYRMGRSNPEPALSAAALMAYNMSGVYPERDKTSSNPRVRARALACQRCLEYVNKTFTVKDLPVPESQKQFTFYAMFYLMQARWLEGGKAWEQSFPKVRDWLLSDKNEFISEGLPIWKGDNSGGNWLYATAVSLIVLQIPYRHLPILER